MRLIKTEYFEHFKSRGVPPSVLLAQKPEDITKHINIIEVPRDTGSIVLDKKKQIEAVAAFERKIQSKKPIDAPLLLIASRSYDFVAMQYALQIVANLTSEVGKPFYWHMLYGNPRDKLRDEDHKLERDCRLLVISNLAENSTAMKVEKARDLLDKFSHIPRILTVGGIDPVLYSRNVLHIKPDYFISC